ncbi:hypothetical protein VTN00DRAFT_6915 [Thermoascus crustaceus]|uniref:uncharacterized protein n=1 Tax=Thermoascus crustaceus TaxID=5088 RepID=UPI00374342AC
MEYLTDLLFFFKDGNGEEYSILDALEKEIKDLRVELERKTIDLIDQQNSRREWQKRALAAEQSLSRNPFAVLLIDGDGYIFKDQFIRDGEKGAIAAANQLCDSFRRSLSDRYGPDNDLPPDMDIVVRLYVNKNGLAGALVDAGIIPNVAHLDAFFVKLTQSRPLFDVVDCGGGKERVDDKIREQYRHYAYNAQCRHISIACCHDSGYVAFLDKYQGDSIVEQKTSLFVAGPSAHNSFAKLGFRRLAPAQDIFRDKTYIARGRRATPTSSIPPAAPFTYAHSFKRPSVQLDSASARGSFVSSVVGSTNSGGRTPSLRTPSLRSPAASPALPASPPPPSPPSPRSSPSSSPGRGSSSEEDSIPVNKSSQRVDPPLPTPSKEAINRLAKRAKNRDLCAEFHLRGNCPQGKKCPHDHDAVKKSVKNALRVALRGKVCDQGLQCRRAKCYYGHHCPVPGCKGKPPCEFVGMHGIEQKVARHVPAAE